MVADVQLLNHVRLLVTPRTAARQASLSSSISQSLLQFMSIESVILSISFSATLFSFVFNLLKHFIVMKQQLREVK